MPSTMISRIDGLTTSVAVKAPIKIMTSSQITLFGEQTINAVTPDGTAISATVLDGDRVGVNGQADQKTNGIYVARSTAWQRAKDFDGSLDAVFGTLVTDSIPLIWRLTTPLPVLFGTSNITFETESGFNQGNLDDLAAPGGASMVGLQRYPTSQVTTVEKVLKRNSPANVFDYMTEAEIADALSYSPVLDHTASIQTALNNHATVEFGLGAFRFSQLVMPLFDQSIIGMNSGNQLYGQTTVFIGFDTTKDYMVWAQKPEWRIEGIVFSGMADGTERGEGTIQNGIKAVGTTQKDLDASIKQCGFIKMRSAVVANGTNIRFDDVIFSGVKYGLEVTVSGGWQNRGFIFSPSCRFHGCGKTNVSSAGVFAPSSTNTIDVEINGCFFDDSTSVFLGFSQGLKISDVTNTRARGTSISLETSGLAPVSSFKRAVNITDFRHESHNVINAAYPVSGLLAVGEMELVVNGFHVDGSGGHGINSTVNGATFDNIVISDAGQFAADSYDGLSTSGANVKIGQVTILSKQNYIQPVNTVRYGVRASAGPVTFGGRISGVGPMVALYVIASTVSFSGDMPPQDTTMGVSNTYAAAMPTSGTYGKGSFVGNLVPAVLGTAPNQYVVAGWLRLTTGSAHVLGTDWVATRTLTGT